MGRDPGSFSGDYADETYLVDNPGWHEGEAPTKAKWVAEILRDNQIRPSSIADIGCGAGHILAAIKADFPDARMHGYDISPVPLQIASAHSDIDFSCEDAAKTQPTGFDVALLLDVFEHVPDYLGFIRQTKNIGTWKVYHIPLDISAQAVVRGTVGHARHICGHLHYFTKETALGTLKDCGLEIIDHRYTCGALTVPFQFRTHISNLPRRLIQVFSRDLSAKLLGGYSLLVLAK